MCGVAGYLLRSPTGDTAVLEGLLTGVRARGPDDEGAALVLRSASAITPCSTTGSRPAIRARYPHLGDHPAGHDVALAHARYAIIDVTDGGHQPFVSADASLVGMLNGEIYNHVELRRVLEADGVSFRTASDTEVLVEGFRRWGDGLWSRLNGFWAAVLYDTRDATLTISRDRMGVAPLYYRETAEGLYFASSIVPLLAVTPRTTDRDRDAVRGFVVAGIKDFGSDTCFRAVKSFPPASVVRFRGGAHTMSRAEVKPFWSLPAARWRAGDLSLDEAAAGLRERLVRAVELRLRADVPVAFELSGGLDSSTIAAAAAVLGVHVPTYTVFVPERNELPFARDVALAFGLTQRVLPAAGDELIAEAAQFARVMEEPYHSPNVFTSLHMRRQIKGDGFAVVVSGSGGDELLGGYEYEFADAAQAALWGEGRRWEAVRHILGHHAGSARRMRNTTRDAIGAIKGRLARALVRHPAAAAPPSPAEMFRGSYKAKSFHERVRHHFEVAHLPYYLRNGDHLTMSIPLEHRFPFLDVDVVEFGTQLPVGYLYRGGWSKFVLRRAFQDLLPAPVAWRREKMGFPFPFPRFLRRHARVLLPYASLGASYAFGDDLPLPYETLVTRDPLLLWRLCSTGLWLEHVG